jgi:hypothetical protein
LTFDPAARALRLDGKRQLVDASADHHKSDSVSRPTTTGAPSLITGREFVEAFVAKESFLLVARERAAYGS